MKKMMALALTALLLVALSIPVLAATITKNPTDLTGPASIKVTLPTIPSGTTADNTYKIYKVFDATVAKDGDDYYIAYKLVDGKTTAPTGFTVDTNGYVSYADTSNTTGELTAADIAAIKAYVTGSDLVATITTTASDTSFTVEGLPYGYYYITTTTGALVIVNSTNPNAEVTDKNEVPPVNKKITGATGVIHEAGQNAIAQIGTDVEYTGTVTKKKGAENYVYKDKMTDGLSFNGDVKVYNADPAGKTETELVAITVATSNYTVGSAGGTGDNAYTFSVAFANTYMDGLANDTVLYIVYTAKITDNALTVDAENNTAWLDYGNIDKPNSTPKIDTNVYSAKITVTKKDGSTSGKGLAGAGFILKSTDGNNNGKFYKKTAGTPDTIEWVAEGQATEFISDENGKLSGDFTGLVPGKYTLIEKTVPNSYTKCDDVEFEITASNYTADNLEQSTAVVNEHGKLLPATGGIGTVIFYVVGTVLVLGAVVMLAMRRRMNAE